MNYYILTAHGAVELQPNGGILCRNIRYATQFNSFAAADAMAQTPPARHNGWYHIVQDAYPAGTHKLPAVPQPLNQIILPPVQISVRVTCTNGNKWTTRFNGTFAEACDYFLGKVFTREDACGTETHDLPNWVELVGAY